MTTNKFYTGLLALSIAAIGGVACTKLDSKVYSVVPNANFWQTPDQIAAGVAPAYTALQALPSGNTFETNEVSSDEIVIPIRGGDWLDNNVHVQEWLHNWPVDNTNINGMWGDLYNGIGKANFTLSIVNSLATPPSNLDAINAEVKVLRDFFYFKAMDNFGNIPYVTSFNVDPSTVTNLDQKSVFDSIEADLKANVPLLPATVDATTYGRCTKWMGYALMAKLYMGAQVYTGTARWADAMAACDQVINSGNYSLLSNYFDNFSPNNSNLTGSGNENIFVVPYDKVNIGGNNWEMMTLHYQNNINFALSGSPWNGFCSTADYYSNYDTASVYTYKGTTKYRTYLDQRAGQFLIGQQYSPVYNYPPSTNVIVSADPSLAIQDAQFGIPLVFTPTVSDISNPSGAFRGAGIRNIKYFPEAGTSGNQSNDMVIFRYADILLMKAECEVRLGTNLADALNLVNQIRTRAYGGDASHNLTAGQLTLDAILGERAKEMAYEGWRRDDLIRYEIASGKPYFTGARNPAKTQDADKHYMLFPIPAQQISANPNLHQNPGYN
ncbi:MAG TPA: RagB/SusD family nutrient uptake outer membrane protein [Chitinophagaceae bacterium]|nr:RagB/SusD family nutrient uptake outer membrane protein [Chitinophagaceae bacterium]